MKRFSITEAVAEPFRQAGRRPLATTIWGLVILAPTVLAFAGMIPVLREMAAAGAFEPGSATTPFDDDFATAMQFQAWAQLANLLQLFAGLFVTTAIIRAVFAGGRGDRAAFLRLGMHELYVAVVAVTIFIGMIIAMVVAVLLAVAIGLALSGMPDPWRPLIYVVMGLGLAIGFLALWGRLALIAPASLRYETFAFVEGWKLGAGQTWRLLGLLVIQFLVAIVIGIALIMLIVIIAMMVGGGVAATNPDAMLAWLQGLPEQPALLIGLAVVLLLPLAWIQGFSNLLVTAPFARAVLDLTADPEPEVPISADTAPNAH
jgi:MFS family permease